MEARFLPSRIFCKNFRQSYREVATFRSQLYRNRRSRAGAVQSTPSCVLTGPARSLARFCVPGEPEFSCRSKAIQPFAPTRKTRSGRRILKIVVRQLRGWNDGTFGQRAGLRFSCGAAPCVRYVSEQRLYILPNKGCRAPVQGMIAVRF